MTSVTSAPSTCDDDVPRIWRTASGMWFTPWMNASPFEPPPPTAVLRAARWLEPQLVVEVAFGEWTADGVLRHPSYLGRRPDKEAARVVREPSP